MSKSTKITISEKRCKQCGICVALCPNQVLTQTLGQYPVAEHLDKCIGCKLCDPENLAVQKSNTFKGCHYILGRHGLLASK